MMTDIFNLRKDIYSVIPFAVIFLLGIYAVDIRVVMVAMFAYFLFVLPGFLIIKLNGMSVLRSFLYGAPLGISITSLLIIIRVSYAGWDLFPILLLYLTLTAGITGLAFLVRGRFVLFEETSNRMNEIPLSIILIISIYLILICLPLMNAGKLTDAGYAFTGLFGHDFILRGLDAVAIAKNIPSDNYFFNGTSTYNYYILWYVMPATVYNLVNSYGNIRDILVIICLCNVPVFLLLVYFAILDFLNGKERLFNYNRIVSTFLIIILCYSYHWIIFILKKSSDSLSIGFLSNILSQMNYLSQAWFRELIFEPHSVLSIMMIILICKLLASQPSYLRGGLIGVILASLALTDTTIFLIIAASYMILSGASLYLTNGKRDLIRDLGGTALTAIGVAVFMFLIKIIVIPEYSNKIIFKPYTVIIVGLPFFLLLNFGPMAVTNFLGIWRGLKFSKQHVFMFIVLVVSIFFMLFLTETLEGNVFLRKALTLARLPVSLFTACFLYNCSAHKAINRALIILLIAAFPTVLTDVYASSDILNKSQTTYVSVNEMDAAAWIKNNVPRNSVVQSQIDYPGYFDYSLTVIFGERKSAIGFWKMAYQRYPNRQAITERVSDVKELFQSDDSVRRYEIAKKLNIDYIFISDVEKTRYPGCDLRFHLDGIHFRRVFLNPEVQIFEVL